ncbi:16S rRNA (uracil(1498)-N(3))-methyltransferase [Actinoplanes solisilvae]|uniref:16S rRNA (uracil(1498)-N(3))-methyltransferase n=1 Tax=Actinoplanes solisilvae TaxID=2486853 RepID=UPI000FD82D2D|nr:16S rRNA (uracil(1498)-N(3))-methyltransferase [Actinoplanes solisilvae]
MSAPLFLVEALPAGVTCTLDGPEGHHAATVQRLRAGETLILADGRGGSATGRVTEVRKGSVAVEIVGREHVPAADPRLVVAQGIAKGDRGELAVQAMTEIGVDEILPWAAARSVAQWRGDRGGKSREKWVATAREAAKQARRAWLPVVGGDPDCSTKQIAARVGEATAFVLHEEATESLTSAALPAAGDIVLVIGPEGGISEAEVETFVAAGATAVRLGREVLRTSTAGVAALSVLSARLGRW